MPRRSASRAPRHRAQTGGRRQGSSCDIAKEFATVNRDWAARNRARFSVEIGRRLKQLGRDGRVLAASLAKAFAASEDTALLAKPKFALWLIGGRVSREVGAALSGRT
jgi:hypothetical protein